MEDWVIWLGTALTPPQRPLRPDAAIVNDTPVVDNAGSEEHLN